MHIHLPLLWVDHVLQLDRLLVRVSVLCVKNVLQELSTVLDRKVSHVHVAIRVPASCEVVFHSWCVDP